MEKGVSLSMKAEKNMEQDLAPLPFSAPTPLLGQADYMLSGIYPHRKKKAGGKEWLLPQETKQTAP